MLRNLFPQGGQTLEGSIQLMRDGQSFDTKEVGSGFALSLYK